MDTFKLRAFTLNAMKTLTAQMQRQYQLINAEDSPVRLASPGRLQTLQELHAALGEAEFAERMAWNWFKRLCALRILDMNGYCQGFMAVSSRENSGEPEILASAREGRFDPEATPPEVQQRIMALLKHRKHPEAPEAAGHALTAAAVAPVTIAWLAHITGTAVPDAAPEPAAAAAPAASSDDPGPEIYSLLLRAVCSYWHQYLPCMFQAVEDSSYLLLPDSLLAPGSVLSSLGETLDAMTCRDVDLPGRLYQFFIEARQDKIHADADADQKQGFRPGAGTLPGASRMFTPRWLVRFLAENSLGRLWILNHPDSRLKPELRYFSAPLKEEKEHRPFIKVNSPTDLRICDPCCGSGAVLACAFELLSKMYAEAGFLPEESAGLILRHNLCGLDTDGRAGELAAFALSLKARALDQNFFKRKIFPKICVLTNLGFADAELEELQQQLVKLQQKPEGQQQQPGVQHQKPGELQPQLPQLNFSPELAQTFSRLFAKTSLQGSLINIPREITGLLPALKQILPALQEQSRQTPAPAEKLRAFITRVELLSSLYDVIISAPPCPDREHQNAELSGWMAEQYPEGKYELCTALMQKAFRMLRPLGYNAMLTTQNWLFSGCFADFRKKLLSAATVTVLAHLGPGIFDSAGAEQVQTEAHILQKGISADARGIYLRLTEGTGEQGKELLFLTRQAPRYCCRQEHFMAKPDNPMAYWLSDKIFELFATHPAIAEQCQVMRGLITTDNERFVRYWPEVSFNRINFNATGTTDAAVPGCRWFPCNKGGENRRWYGNQEYIVNWEADGRDIRNIRDDTGRVRYRPRKNTGYFFRESVSWALKSTSFNTFRYFPAGFIFDIFSMSLFTGTREQLYAQLGFLNSTLAGQLINALNPNLNLPYKIPGRLPYIQIKSPRYPELIQECVNIARDDWNSQEISWNFTENQLLHCQAGDSPEHGSIEAAWEKLKAQSLARTKRLQELETENNRIVNSELGLADEIPPEVPLSEITLFCNPAWRYKDSTAEEEKQWKLYRADVIKDFISWAVGCMFGRFAPDRPGLILASQDAGLEAYYTQIPRPLFRPCEDNIIPFYTEGIAASDIVARLCDFIKTVFGAGHYEENISFIENSLNPDTPAGHCSLRRYFQHDFYPDHTKRYHNRPVYWLFDCPRGTFRALIYLHRYTPGTNYLLLIEYLRPCIAWLQQQQSAAGLRLNDSGLSPKDRTLANWQVKHYGTELKLLKKYELKLQDFCAQHPELNLDDGVKANYLKFGSLLKKVTHLSK